MASPSELTRGWGGIRVKRWGGLGTWDGWGSASGGVWSQHRGCCFGWGWGPRWTPGRSPQHTHTAHLPKERHCFCGTQCLRENPPVPERVIEGHKEGLVSGAGPGGRGGSHVPKNWALPLAPTRPAEAAASFPSVHPRLPRPGLESPHSFPARGMQDPAWSSR